MATSSGNRTLWVTFSAKDELSSGIKSATSSVKGFTSGLTGSNKSVSSFGTSLTSVAKKAAVAVSAFVSLRSAVNFGKEIVQTGMEFEQSMANVQALSGATGEEFEMLSKKAQEMGSTTVFTAQESADAMSYMALAGWDAEEMCGGIEGILNLAAASSMDLATASDIVTDNLSAFGLTAADSAELVDKMAYAMSSSNTSTEQLGEAYTKVAATSTQLGYDLNDTTAALMVMADAGIKGGTAGTALSSIMTRLGTNTSGCRDALAKYGVEVYDSEGNVKSLSSILEGAKSAWSSLTDEQKSNLAYTVAGKNAQSQFMTLMGDSTGSFEEYAAGLRDCTGAAQEMADTMNDTVSGQWTLLQSQIDGVKLAIYEALDASKFKDVIKKMSSALSALTPYIETIVVGIGEGIFNAIDKVYSFASNAFHSIQSWIENNRPAIDALKSAFDNLKTSISNAFSGLSNGDGSTITSIFSMIVSGITTAMNAISTAVDMVSPVISVLYNAFKGIFSFLAEHQGILTAVVGGFVAFKSLSGITSIVGGLGSAFKGLFGGLSSGGTSGGGISGISGLFDGFANMKTTSVLKAVTNMGIVFAGVTALAAGIMALSPYLAELSDAQSLIEVLAVITVVGLIGSGLAELAGVVGKIPVTTVVKGLANIGVVMVGIGALSAGIMVVSGLLADVTDVSALKEFIGTIAVVGLVGAALTAVAGIVGMIPIALVVSGLAGIATAIGGFAAIVAAFAALASIPGYTEFMEQGGAALAQLSEILGDVIGSFVGGMLEGVTSALPAIGESLAGFAEAAQPFFELASGSNLSGVGDFLKSFAEFALMMTANDILSFFTGGMDLTTLGTELSEFVISAIPFFTTVMMIPTAAFTNAAALFQCLADIGNVPNTGGVMQWFTGTNDYASLAEGLGELCSKDVVKFLMTMTVMQQAAFDNAAAFFECLGDIGNIPNTGGVAQWFSGTNDYGDLAEGLGLLADEKVVGFFNTVSNYTEAAFTNAAAFFECLGDIGNVPNTGGIGQWFSGTNDYGALADGLADLSDERVTGFFTLMGSLTTSAFNNAKALFELFGEMGTFKTGGVKDWFNGGVSFANINTALGTLAGWNTTTFLTKMGEMSGSEFENMKDLFKVFDKLGEYATKGVSTWFGGDVDYKAINSGLGQLATGAVPFFIMAAMIPENSFTNVKLLFECLDEIGNYSASGLMQDSAMLDGFADGIASIAQGVNIFAATVNDTSVSALINVISSLKDLSDTVSATENNVSSRFEAMAAAVATKCSAVKTTIAEMANTIKTTLQKVDLTSTGASIIQSLINGINSMKTSLKSAVSSLASTVSSAYSSSITNIKLPHFSISPSGWKASDLLNGTIPSLSVQWYKNGGIIDAPTFLGWNGTSAMVGGEAGAEAVIPLAEFWDRLADMLSGNDRPQTANNNNYVYVTVTSDGRNDAELANLIAQRVVSKIDNM